MTMPTVRKIITVLMIKKYRLALSLTASSACIHRGMNGDKVSVTIIRKIPMTTALNTAIIELVLVRSLSPAPYPCEISVRAPMAKEYGSEPTSQVTVVVVLTAAVALSPRCPTIAVSTYCMIVPMIFCKIAGKASKTMDFAVFTLSYLTSGSIFPTPFTILPYAAQDCSATLHHKCCSPC